METIDYNLPDHSVDLLQYLIDQGSASQSELLKNLDLPLRTIRYAIRRLKEEQFIVSKPDLLDMRSLRYSINESKIEKIETILMDTSKSPA